MFKGVDSSRLEPVFANTILPPCGHVTVSVTCEYRLVYAQEEIQKAFNKWPIQSSIT